MLIFVVSFFLSFSLFAQEQEKLVPSAANDRFKKEELFQFQNFILMAHRQNYVLPVTYNFQPNNYPYEQLREKGIDTGLDRVMRFEAKFQLSFKFPLGRSLFWDDDSIWAAYTQLSFWQVYNQNSSRPFRESNYEPEFFYLKRLDLNWGNFRFEAFTIGLVHQSNGQTENLSRSWNRAYLTTIFSFKHFAFTFKPWYRFSDGKRDENPDLEKYLGNYEARVTYSNAGWVYSLLIRNRLKDDFKGYREFSINFPLDRNLKGFIQYCNGYGESLLDYRSNTNRIGLGLIVSDFL